VQSDRTHTQLVKAFLTGCECIYLGGLGKPALTYGSAAYSVASFVIISSLDYLGGLCTNILHREKSMYKFVTA